MGLINIEPYVYALVNSPWGISTNASVRVKPRPHIRKDPYVRIGLSDHEIKSVARSATQRTQKSALQVEDLRRILDSIVVSNFLVSLINQARNAFKLDK